MTKVAQFLARLMGVLLLLFGVCGFLPNPFIGSEGMIQADAYNSGLHLIFGILLLAMSGGEGKATFGLYLVAALATMAALVGYMMVDSHVGRGMLFQTMMISRNLTWLHAGIAAALVVCAQFNTSSRQIIRD